MLIKITNYCSLGCNHCLENSTVTGQHMDPETFAKALAFTARAEQEAWARGCFTYVLLSGGECTEHPDILKFIERVDEMGFIPMLLTNGMWLDQPELRDAILTPKRKIYIQLTNDRRFYPRKPPKYEDKRITTIPELSLLMALGRAKDKKSIFQLGVPPRTSPSSFNLRSLTRAYNSFTAAVAALRMRATAGQSGQCTPSISDDGTITAGESRFCYPIGTVDSTMEEVTNNILNMGSCNRCGLEDNLSQAHKRAIGTSILYAANE